MGRSSPVNPVAHVGDAAGRLDTGCKLRQHRHELGAGHQLFLLRADGQHDGIDVDVALGKAGLGRTVEKLGQQHTPLVCVARDPLDPQHERDGPGAGVHRHRQERVHPLGPDRNRVDDGRPPEGLVDLQARLDRLDIGGIQRQRELRDLLHRGDQPLHQLRAVLARGPGVEVQRVAPGRLELGRQLLDRLLVPAPDGLADGL